MSNLCSKILYSFFRDKSVWRISRFTLFLVGFFFACFGFLVFFAELCVVFVLAEESLTKDTESVVFVEVIESNIPFDVPFWFESVADSLPSMLRTSPPFA